MKSIEQFIAEYRLELISRIQSYLEGGVSHGDMFDYTCEIIDRWHELPDDVRNAPYAEREKQFWTAIWTIQALASENHWADGLPQKEFPKVMKVLAGKEKFPKYCDGGRPSA